jgi:two-component system, OmpR family, phosphate regulon response regulator PhoB
MQGSILVVDRDLATRELIADNLRHAGYRVACAGDTAEAEVLARTTHPDAAVFDWPPGTPGLTFARQLRADRRNADTSIIIISARSSVHDRIAALETGADDYIMKPFSVRELLARIKAVLRRRTPQLDDEAVVIDGLRFEPAARRVTAAGHEISLRNTEFRLLHFFMTHPRRAFSRCQLLDEVWGDQSLVEERTVDVHVRRLRRALAWSRHDDLIETVRGVGYRFRTDVGRDPTAVLCSTLTDFGRNRDLARDLAGQPGAQVVATA